MIKVKHREARKTPLFNESIKLVFSINKISKVVVYVAPIVILVIGLIGYFIAIPQIYGKIISIGWIFTDPQNIIDTLFDPDTVLFDNNSMLELRIIGWIWLSVFIISLFFLGKQLHTRSKSNAANAIMIKKEPYLMIKEIRDTLRQTMLQRDNKDLDELMIVVKYMRKNYQLKATLAMGEV